MEGIGRGKDKKRDGGGGGRAEIERDGNVTNN